MIVVRGSKTRAPASIIQNRSTDLHGKVRGGRVREPDNRRMSYTDSRQDGGNQVGGEVVEVALRAGQ